MELGLSKDIEQNTHACRVVLLKTLKNSSGLHGWIIQKLKNSYQQMAKMLHYSFRFWSEMHTPSATKGHAQLFKVKQENMLYWAEYWQQITFHKTKRPHNNTSGLLRA